MADIAAMIARAACAYFGIVFAIGFVLGTVRVLWAAPALGETGAVIAELPLMLAASWYAARGLLGRFGVERTADRAAMGALAFVLLIAAEAALGVFAFGQPLAEWAADLVRMPGVFGLVGQIAFAAMPVVAGRQPLAAIEERE